MRKKWVLVILVVTILTAPSVFAKKGAEQSQSGEQQMNRHDPAKMFEGLGLTEDQQEKIKNIKTEAREKFQEAQTPEEKMELRKQMHDQIMGILTEEQAEKFAKMSAGMKQQGKDKNTESNHSQTMQNGPAHRLPFDQLDLTAEQKEQIQQIRKEAMEKMHNDIMSILTDEQKEKLADLKKNFKDGPDSDSEKPENTDGSRKREFDFNRLAEKLDLTQGQQTRIEELQQAAREKASNAEPQERKEIFEKLRDEIKNILTDEQVKELEEMRQNFTNERGHGRKQ